MPRSRVAIAALLVHVATAVTLAAPLAIVAGCGDGLDPRKLTVPESGCRPGPSPVPRCAAAAVPVNVCVSGPGDWTLVAPAGLARYAELTLLGAPARAAAAAVDWDDPDGKEDLAGFALARGASAVDAADEALDVARAISRGGAYQSVELLASGAPGKTHDGRPLVRGTVLELRVAGTAPLYRARNPLFPLLTGLDVDQLKNLPEAPVEPASVFVLSYATALPAAERAVIVGSVAPADTYHNRQFKTRLRALDLANGTALGPLGATLTAGCGALPASGAAGRLDTLWIVDSSEASVGARIRLHQAAAVLWRRGRASGVDFRAAVVDMAQARPTSAVGLCRPKGCSGAFFLPDDEGLACFQQCLLGPSDSRAPPPAADSRGLESARRALLAVLPRGQADALRLRVGAQTALVFASEVEDGDVAALAGGGADRAPLDALLAPLADLLAGRANAANELPPGTTVADLAGTVSYALVPFPLEERAVATACGGGRQRGAGYRRLAQLGGGFFGNLCAADQDPLLEWIAEDAAARATASRGALVLPGRPASASLGAALDGAALFRSARRGFDYTASSNALLLWEVTGGTLDVGYVAW